MSVWLSLQQSYYELNRCFWISITNLSCLKSTLFSVLTIIFQLSSLLISEFFAAVQLCFFIDRDSTFSRFSEIIIAKNAYWLSVETLYVHMFLCRTILSAIDTFLIARESFVFVGRCPAWRWHACSLSGLWPVLAEKIIGWTKWLEYTIAERTNKMETS